MNKNMGGIGLVWGEELPVLRYLKDPVENLNDLYRRYPNGGEYGWFAFVFAAGTFAWWDQGDGEWRLLQGESGGSHTENGIVNLGRIALEYLDGVTDTGLYFYNKGINRGDDAGLLAVFRKRSVSAINSTYRQVRHEQDGDFERTGVGANRDESITWGEWSSVGSTSDTTGYVENVDTEGGVKIVEREGNEIHMTEGELYIDTQRLYVETSRGGGVTVMSDDHVKVFSNGNDVRIDTGGGDFFYNGEEVVTRGDIGDIGFQKGEAIDSISRLDKLDKPGSYAVNLSERHPILGNNYFSLLVQDSNGQDGLTQMAIVYDDEMKVYVRGGEADSWGDWTPLGGGNGFVDLGNLDSIEQLDPIANDGVYIYAIEQGTEEVTGILFATGDYDAGGVSYVYQMRFENNVIFSRSLYKEPYATGVWEEWKRMGGVENAVTFKKSHSEAIISAADMLPNESEASLRIAATGSMTIRCGGDMDLCLGGGRGTIYIEPQTDNDVNINTSVDEYGDTAGKLLYNGKEVVREGVPSGTGHSIYGYMIVLPQPSDLPSGNFDGGGQIVADGGEDIMIGGGAQDGTYIKISELDSRIDISEASSAAKAYYKGREIATKGDLSGYVKTTGYESISGVKHFVDYLSLGGGFSGYGNIKMQNSDMRVENGNMLLRMSSNDKILIGNDIGISIGYRKDKTWAGPVLNIDSQAISLAFNSSGGMHSYVKANRDLELQTIDPGGWNGDARISLKTYPNSGGNITYHANNPDSIDGGHRFYGSRLSLSSDGGSTTLFRIEETLEGERSLKTNLDKISLRSSGEININYHEGGDVNLFSKDYVGAGKAYYKGNEIATMSDLEDVPEIGNPDNIDYILAYDAYYGGLFKVSADQLRYWLGI